MLAAILGDIARARGMSEIAKASGLTREALYKALRPDELPRFDTISRVCTASGSAGSLGLHMPLSQKEGRFKHIELGHLSSRGTEHLVQT